VQDVVVTGMGVVSPLGHTVDRFWDNLLAGTVAVRTSTPEESGSEHGLPWAPMTDFDPASRLDERVVAGTDRFTQILLVAAEDAVADAGLDAPDPLRTAVVSATAMGGLGSVVDAQSALERSGPDAVPAKTQIRMWPNMGAAQVAYRWKLHGPQLTLCTACAASLDAIGTGARFLESGIADVAIVGGSDAQLRPLMLLSAGGLGAGSTVTDPARASLPFDKDRSGMVIGEGGGVLVLERRDHALARGATPYATVAGYGSLADSYHPSSPDPTGEWQTLTMQQALDDAGLDVGAVGGVLAHGTATRLGDTSEIRAVNRYLGERARDVPVASVKGHLGHSSGASASMSAIAAIRALRDGRMVMNAGTTDPDDEARFEIVTGVPAPLSGEAVQVNAFGFGGQNASVVLTPA
jgi:3-oxoacyl-[acyl-carrier-protein] synthase II